MPTDEEKITVVGKPILTATWNSDQWQCFAAPSKERLLDLCRERRRRESRTKALLGLLRTEINGDNGERGIGEMKASGCYCWFIVFPCFFLCFFLLTSADNPNRRILHQPLFPVSSTPPPPPPQQPDEPEDPTSDWPFFPQAPPGATPVATDSATPPPVNVSSNPSRTSSPPTQTKTITIAVSVSVAALVLVIGLGLLLYRRRIGRPAEEEKLFTNNPMHFAAEGSGNGSELLYLGTMEPANGREGEVGLSPYRKLSAIRRAELHRPSPELQPMPPLNGSIRQVPLPIISSDEDTTYYSPNCSSVTLTSEGPRSPESSEVPAAAVPGARAGGHRRSYSAYSCRTSPKTRFSNSAAGGKQASQPPESSTATAPPPPPPRKFTPLNSLDNPSKLASPVPEKMVLPPVTSNQPQLPPKGRSHLPPPAPPPGEKISYTTMRLPPDLKRGSPTRRPLPPPPPPPPPPAFKVSEASVRPGSVQAPTDSHLKMKPSPMQDKEDKLATPAAKAKDSISGSNSHGIEDNGDETKPRLKPLHWDKVRATSDRATVWDQLKSSSFKLNEDMIETLFVSNCSNPLQKESARRPVLPPFPHENRVLDPKKSQNIAILLRALNVTREEVTEALLDGNPEGLGVELLETLVKMAPTKEEELKLRDYSGDVSKLGSAERFLTAVLDIPLAFKRVDAMLYRANFETEVNYLRKSFETLEAACEELKNSRLFLKLLEAVLRTGNRMNVGTYRGEAKAFKLDTLLKLVDVKGADGKTTLLHFVVQEIIRSEGPESENNLEDQKKPLAKTTGDEFKKHGLQVVAGLSRELGNVKKAAGMDSDVLSGYLSKLEMGLGKIKSVLKEKSSSQGKFFEAMRAFIMAAEDEILRIKAEEAKSLQHVKEVTEYFHGDAAKEEAHPFRIFMVVRDFLAVLDQVCKEVGTLQERTMVGAARSFRISASASLPVLDRYSMKQGVSCDDDTSSP